MNIREYKKEDGRQVDEIFFKYWTDKEFLEELTEEIKSENTYFYVAEQEGEIKGKRFYQDCLL